jgi:hypothetical protein
MKKLIILVLMFLLVGFSGIYAQGNIPQERLSFSSGGGSNPQMPVSIGEPFGFSGPNVTIGSQQNSGNGTVGILPSSPKSRIVVFPNPVEDELNVQVIGKDEANFSVKLHDLLGRELVFQREIYKQTKLSLVGIQSNTFLVSVYDKNGIILFTETIVKP